VIHFESELWTWRSDGGTAWHFVTLPDAARDAVKAEIEGIPRKGFGSVKVNVTIGKSTFSTSLFPAKEYGSYLLPVKASVRKANGLLAGDTIKVAIELI
jgi:hypothetical protein